MYYALLPGRGLLRLNGEDTFTFLNGLVSNDVAPLKEGKAVYAALLSPQGKFLHDFFLYPEKDGVLLDVERSRLHDLLQKLKMYKLRSRVIIEEMMMLTIAAVWGGNVSPGFADPRLKELGWRMVGDATSLKMLAEGMQPGDYEAMRLQLGVPDGAHDLLIDKSLLLEWGFEDLHGVDFQKGCYVGQEVTARSKHRAQLRKHFYQIKTTQGDLPPSGTPILLAGEEAGQLRSHDGKNGIALLRIEAVEKAQKEGLSLCALNATLEVALPPWLTEKPQSLIVEK